MSNFATALLSHGRDDAPAIVAGDRTLTYAGLRTLVDALALHLSRGGIAPGDRVGVLAENGPFAIAGYLAAVRAGGVAVPLAPSYSAAHLVRQLDCVEARFALIDAALRDRFPFDLVPTLERVLVGPDSIDPITRTPSRPAGAAPDAEGLAAIMFTSGSTGDPRGVMVTHENLLANTGAIISSIGLDDRDRTLLVLPWYYCFGASVIQTHLFAGGAVAIGTRLSYPEVVLDQVEASRATGLYGVPSTFQILLRRGSLATRRLPSLRYVAQAGGRLPEPFLRELLAIDPPLDVHVMYGQTEATARLACLPPALLGDKLGSIGRAIPGTTLHVLREDGTPAAQGEVGEIVAEGPGVTRGYFRDPEATARYFRGGRLHTGDLAVADADGCLYIRGRERDLIKAGGIRVSPAEIEEVLAALPDVLECAVAATPDDLFGEAIVSYVVARPGSDLTPAAILAHCRAHLPIAKVPRHVHLRESLPRTASGKIARAALV